MAGRLTNTRSLFVSVLTLVTSLCGAADTIIDLSHPVADDTIYWPGYPASIGLWIEVGAFTSGEHGGTHMDAPRHFYVNGYDLKDLPLDRTIAEGITINVKAEAAANNDYALTVNKLLDWEEQHGRIPDNAAILVNTGWSARWPNPQRFFNTNDPTDPTTFHFPIVSKDAAVWLVQNRNIKILGLDVPAPDGPRDNTFPVHTTLLSRNIIILENMMLPDSLPARGFRVHASPIRIEGGTGVQTRMYAMLYGENSALTNFGKLGIICSLFTAFLLSLFFSRM